MSSVQPEKKTCIVGYKTRVLGHLTHSHGFDSIDTCCEKFKETVLYTQNRREPHDDVITTCKGIYLVKRRDTFYMVIRVGERELMVKFCPFCGAEIEVQETRRVRIIRTGGFRNNNFKEKTIKRGHLALVEE